MSDEIAIYYTMHIEFRLPSGAGGMAALHASKHIRDRVQAWAAEHNVKITSAHTGYRMTFILAEERDYTLFALSWQSSKGWDQYYIVTDSGA